MNTGGGGEPAQNIWQIVRQEEPAASLRAFEQVRTGTLQDLAMLGVSAPLGFVVGVAAHSAFPRAIGPVSIPGALVGVVAVGAAIWSKNETLAVRGSMAVTGVAAVVGGVAKAWRLAHP